MREKLDDREKLQLDTKQDTKRIFEILNVIGFGATCIVYNACFYDEYNIRHYVKIKECCPLSGVSGRDGLRVVWNSVNEQTKAIQAFEKMYAQHMKLQEIFDVVNSTCKISDLLYYGNDTVYLIMESDYGASFDKAIPDTLFEILQAIYALSNTIQKYHEIGFLHLDIKPQNFMVIPETKELVKLFDFDSLVSLNDINVGIAENISYSNEWAAPEVRQKKVKKIRETADVYSVGTVLFYALFRRTIEAKDKVNFGKYDFGNIEIVNQANPMVKKKLSAFLCNTLNPVVDKRYQDMGAVKLALKEMMVIADPTRNYICNSIPDQVNYFGGRKVELFQASQILKEKKRVIITGIGGIGKSEFSKQFAHQFKEDFSSVVWVKCEGSFSATLMEAGNFIVANSNNERNSAEYKNHGEKLEAISSVVDSSALLIVDDIKDFSEKTLLDFLKLQCNIMITTRTYTSNLFSNMESINLGCMDITELHSVFKHYYRIQISNDETQIIDKVIGLLGNYTLLVPIIAKQMTVSAMKPSEMFQKLQQQGTFVDLPEKVQHMKDEVLIDEVLAGHLKKVFDISDIDENKLLVLRVLSMLDDIKVGKKSLSAWCGFRNDYDMDFKYKPFLESMYDRVDLSAVNSLIDSGWLQYDELTDRISIHKVISDLIRSEYTPNVKNCSPFVRTLEKIAENIEEWKQEYDDELMLYNDSVNKYEVDMYLHVINTCFGSLQIDDDDTANIMISILAKVYKANSELFIGTIDRLVNDDYANQSKSNIAALRTMQVFAYFYRYNITYYLADGCINKEYEDTKIANATEKFKEAVKIIRKEYDKPELYEALSSLYEGPKYLCDYYVWTLFDDKDEYQNQYKYMLRIINEIIVNTEGEVKENAETIKRTLTSSHREYREYRNRSRQPYEKPTYENDHLDYYTEELSEYWDDMDKTFAIISRIMSDLELSISGKQCAIEDAGYNNNEWLLIRSIPIISEDKEEKEEKRSSLLSAVELEASLFLKEMAINGLFKEGLTVSCWENIDTSILRQCLYGREYSGLLTETQRQIYKIGAQDSDLLFLDTKVRDFQSKCEIFEYFDLDILALWIYRSVDEDLIGRAEEYYFLDSNCSYPSFISNAMDCAERLGDYESYYYFFGRMRDNLNVDFAFDRDKKPNVVKGNNTFKKWKDYTIRLADAKDVEDLDLLYQTLREDESIHIKAKRFLLNVLEEKVSLKRVRINKGRLPLKCIPNVSLLSELEEKHSSDTKFGLIETIDELAEIVFQAVLIHDESKSWEWTEKYISLLETIRGASQDTVLIGRYYFLPKLLIELNENALAEKILFGMYNKWISLIISDLSYYELKTNETYFDKIYEAVASDDEIKRYEDIKNSITSHWVGEDHLTQYC